MTSIISMEGICYGVRTHFWSRDKSILKNVTLGVEPGEMFGFLGPNGAGKTTSIKILLGLLEARSGRVSICGRGAHDPRAREGIGYLPERSYYPTHFSAFEMVWQHALLAGLSMSDARTRTRAVLEQVGLGKAQNARLGTFSKGMLQRAGLAQAIIGRPKLAVLDEPMSGLDPLGRRDVRELMLELQRQGTTVFFCTHILPDVELICDRVAILVGGTVRRVGALNTLLADGEGGIEVAADGVNADGWDKNALPGLRTTKAYAGGINFEVANIAQANVLIDQVRQRGGTVRHVQNLRGSLEDLFVKEANV